MTKREPQKIELNDSNSIKCWCQGCGQEFRIHPLFPLVYSELQDHKCPRTIPTPMFTKEIIELKPYDMPVSKLLEMDYKYPEPETFLTKARALLERTSPVSDGLSDGYRMEREALAAEEREEAEKDKFDLRMNRLMRNRIDDLHEYMSKRREYFHMDEYQQKLYPGKKAQLKRDLEGLQDALVINLKFLVESLEKKL